MRLSLLACGLVLAAWPALAAGNKNPYAVIDTSAGELRCELFQDKVPNAVANFIALAEGTRDWTDPKTRSLKHGVPLYDGTVFHRIVPGFMIQGGDPSGTGQGKIGFAIPDEFVPKLTFDRPGRLAYANSGPNTSGSQFFITEAPVPHLDPCLEERGCNRDGTRVPRGYGHTIFGQCDMRSVETVKWIAKSGRDLETNRPIRPVVIRHVRIERPDK